MSGNLCDLIRSLSVFFDLENAYDTTWRYGILKYLLSMAYSVVH